MNCGLRSPTTGVRSASCHISQDLYVQCALLMFFSNKEKEKEVLFSFLLFGWGVVCLFLGDIFWSKRHLTVGPEQPSQLCSHRPIDPESGFGFHTQGEAQVQVHPFPDCQTAVVLGFFSGLMLAEAGLALRLCPRGLPPWHFTLGLWPLLSLGVGALWAGNCSV